MLSVEVTALWGMAAITVPAARGGRQPYTAALTLLIVLFGVALISLSPLALGSFRGATAEWERLSFIGQTYGAASAVVSVLALVGVVLTRAGSPVRQHLKFMIAEILHRIRCGISMKAGLPRPGRRVRPGES